MNAGQDEPGGTHAVRFALVLGAVATLGAGVLMFFSRGAGGPPIPMLAVVVSLVLFVVAVGIVSVVRAQRRNTRRMFESLSVAGFDVKQNVRKGEREQLFAPFAQLKELSTGLKGLKWFATRQIDGREFTLFQHSYTVHTGQSASTITHVVAATACPDWWPQLSLSRETIFHKIADKLGMKDLQLESETFNKAWRVKTDDEDMAIVILTPTMQEWLEGSPKKESWRIGSGVVCCLSQRSLVKSPPVLLIDRVREFLALVPSEALADAN